MAKGLSRLLVVSAVNFTEGGPLTALRDCLSAAVSTLSGDWQIIALVHDCRLFDVPRVQFLEFPHVKRSWVSRLYHEYWCFDKLSRKLKPDVWFSLHDISPRVTAPRQVVYCHNPSPFYQPRWGDVWWDPKFLLFTLFYRYLYRLNIHANDLIVVQQEWIRQAFQRMFGVRNVAVAHPILAHAKQKIDAPSSARPGVFLYPALPRVFKNFEVLCEAAQILRQRVGDTFEVRLTISGEESRYTANLKRQYSDTPVIHCIGRQNKDQMVRQYQDASAIVFPSRLETWGLPISEAKDFGKPLIVSDLPYAHESVGDYDRAVFFNPQDPQQLATIMLGHLQGELHYQSLSRPAMIDQPFAANWDELIPLVVGEANASANVLP